MQDEFAEADLLSLLKNGVKRSIDLIAHITDYHGGPVTTEYMLTSDLARELIEQNYQVEVEYLNRNFANGLTMRRSGRPIKKFGSKRTDVAVLFNHFAPLAMIEIKTGVKTVRGIAADLIKITDTIDALKPEFASRVWGAAVFQVHIPGSKSRYEEAHFKAAIDETMKLIGKGLTNHAKTHPNYNFRLHSLQAANEGYTPRELEPDGNGGFVWGQDGHATRYYAVLIKSKIAKPRLPRTIEELKAYSQT
ncbi:hypothetical protein HAP41_0000001460 [Bradyrhizobium barranii subsp. apii]|uniref:Uncharacterized protein n=1 Tax=Bradyrhizobium barranii subsp. apii TaxID=2819348 RepID=A0A8T5UVI3_9BRAD|nr:hypothetical protein [Bradyrhizobium barranii]UPT87858.1 hypothetical protein HAP41_0000001460 [Bradyrhizobium barranii subsp. apii]